MPTEAQELEELIRLEAERRGVDADLAVAVAWQESGLNTAASGDGGKSLGLFQLQEAAARDAGIDPRARHQVLPNIEGGVEYLRQSLARAPGNVALGLHYYNKGPSLEGGNPRYAVEVLRRLPGSGRTPAPAAPTMSATERAERAELAALEAELRGAPVTQDAPAQTPAARPFASEIAQAEAEVERTRVASPEEAAARVQELRDIFTPYGDLQPDLPQGPRQQIVIEKGSGPAYRQANPLAVGGFVQPGDVPPTPRTMSEADVGRVQRSPVGTPLERPIEPALSPLDLGLSGYGGGLAASATSRVLPRVVGRFTTAVPQWVSRATGAGLGAELLYKTEQATGLQEGKPTEFGLADVANLAIPGAIEGTGAAWRRFGPAGRAQRAVNAADDATRAGRRTYESVEAERLAAYRDKRQVAQALVDEQNAAARAKWTQEGRAADDAAMQQYTKEQMAYRDATAAADEAERVAMEKYRDLQMARRDAQAQAGAVTDEAAERYFQAQRDFEAAEQAYARAVDAHAAAVPRLRAIPEHYLPQVPKDLPQPGAVARELPDTARASAHYYRALDEVGREAPVYTDLVSNRIDQLVDELAPLSAVSPSVGRVRSILTTLKELGDTDVKTVNGLLRQLRPLTATTNSEVKYAAMRAMDLLSEAVELTADMVPATQAAGALMKQARAAFRTEKAVETVRHAFRDAGPIISLDAQGRQVVNVKAAVNVIDKLMAKDRYFAGSFTPEALAQLKQDIRQTVIGTPDIPRTRPTPPRAQEYQPRRQVDIPPVPERPTFEPRPSRPPPPRQGVREPPPAPKQVRMAPYRPKPAPEPVAPATQLRSPVTPLQAVKSLGIPGVLGWQLSPAWTAAVGATKVGANAVDWLTYKMAKTLLTPQGRERLARIMSKDGTLTAEQFKRLTAGIKVPTATLDAEAREGERRRRAEGRRRAEELERRQRARRQVGG